jgi:hypothetical protein
LFFYSFLSVSKLHMNREEISLHKSATVLISMIRVVAAYIHVTAVHGKILSAAGSSRKKLLGLVRQHLFENRAGMWLEQDLVNPAVSLEPAGR